MPKMKWSDLRPMQLGRYAEYYSKMEFASYGYDVYTSEVDDHGVDFVAREKTGIYYEIQVKSLLKGNYAFIPEKLMDCNDSKRLVCFLKLMMIWNDNQPQSGKHINIWHTNYMI